MPFLGCQWLSEIKEYILGKTYLTISSGVGNLGSPSITASLYMSNICIRIHESCLTFISCRLHSLPAHNSSAVLSYLPPMLPPCQPVMMAMPFFVVFNSISQEVALETDIGRGNGRQRNAEAISCFIFPKIVELPPLIRNLFSILLYYLFV